MRNLLSLIKTNLKVISRSRLSTVLVLLAPILIVFLIGTAFSSSSLGGINVGVYSEGYSNLTYSIMQELEQEQFYSEQFNSELECIESVKTGLTEICVIFPSDLSMEGNKQPITIHADNSRVDLAYNLINEINSQVSEKGSELGIAMTDDILNALSETKDVLPSQNEKLQQVITNLNEISSKEDSASEKISQLNSSISELEGIINEIGSQNISGSIEDDLNSLNTQLVSIQTGLYENIENTQSLNTETKTSIIETSSKITEIVEKIFLISDYDAEDIVDPIKTEVEFINKDSTNWEKLFPTLIALIILLSSIVLSSTMVLNERKSRAHFRNFMTPTSDLTFILGMYITSVIIISLQLLVLFGGTVLLTGLPLGHIAGGIALSSFLSASVFILVGMFIGYLFKSDETTILASISVAALFIFFSNVIFPTETIVGGFKHIVSYNPLFISENILRKIILFNSEIATMIWDFVILFGVGLFFFFLGLLFRKITKRNM